VLRIRSRKLEGCEKSDCIRRGRPDRILFGLGIEGARESGVVVEYDLGGLDVGQAANRRYLLDDPRRVAPQDLRGRIGRRHRTLASAARDRQPEEHARSQAGMAPHHAEYSPLAAAEPKRDNRSSIQ
jgi:hypothetical protein